MLRLPIARTWAVAKVNCRWMKEMKGLYKLIIAISMNKFREYAYESVRPSPSLSVQLLPTLLPQTMVHNIMIQHKPIFSLRLVELVGNANNWIFI